MAHKVWRDGYMSRRPMARKLRCGVLTTRRSCARCAAMELLSLTVFADFALLSGAPRATAVRARREVPFDLYVDIKTAIVEVLRGGRPIGDLGAVMASATDARAKRLWPALIEGFTTWHAAHSAPWYEPPLLDVQVTPPGVSPLLRVRVNPEVGIACEGGPCFVKLWLRDAPLTAKRVAVTVALMREAIRPAVPAATYGVLDVRAGKLHTCAQTAVLDRTWQALRGDGAAYAALWGMA